jgi:hypothetical protein
MMPMKTPVVEALDCWIVGLLDYPPQRRVINPSIHQFISA